MNVGVTYGETCNSLDYFSLNAVVVSPPKKFFLLPECAYLPILITGDSKTMKSGRKGIVSKPSCIAEKSWLSVPKKLVRWPSADTPITPTPSFFIFPRRHEDTLGLGEATPAGCGCKEKDGACGSSGEGRSRRWLLTDRPRRRTGLRPNGSGWPDVVGASHC